MSLLASDLLLDQGSGPMRVRFEVEVTVLAGYALCRCDECL